MGLKQLRLIKLIIIICLVVFGVSNNQGLVILLAALLGYFEIRNLASKYNLSSHDTELSPLNNLLKHTDHRTVQQLMNFGLWEYDSTSQIFTLSPKCRQLLSLNPDTIHVSLIDLIESIHIEDQEMLSEAFSKSDDKNRVFLEVRSTKRSDYNHWLRFQGDAIEYGDNKRIIGGRLIEATEKVLVKRIQLDMRELLTDVIEHKPAIDTLHSICESVFDIEPAINCVIFLRTENSDAPILIHSKHISDAFHSILETVTLVNQASEYVQTQQHDGPLYIADLHQLDAWQSLDGVVYKEHTRTFIGQSISSTDKRVHGVVALYMPNSDLPKKVTEVFLASIYKVVNITVESQLQTDAKDEIQQQLYHSQKMDTLGYLTGGIAHDFNNILGSIVGYNGLARKVANKLQNQQLSGYLDEVTIASGRARELIDQMMTYSRAEPVEKMIIEPQTVVKEAIHLVRSMIPSSIDIRQSHSKNLPKIEINPISLHQIILNHLINAKDAFPDFSGVIEINTYPAMGITQTCRSCQQEFSGNYVAIEIKDNGCGIPEQVEKHIFNPFFTTKEVGRGSGMGLSVVHSLLHDANSHVSIKSEVDVGTTFTLYFPEDKAENTTEQTPENTEAVVDDSSGQGQHIMVVDDDVPLSILMAEILSNHDYTVSRFESGTSALEQFQKTPDAFDLVLTDQTMPIMTGDEMARSMLALKPKLPIVVCTGFSEKLTHQLAQEIGIKKVLKKPVEITELLDEIASYLPEN